MADLRLIAAGLWFAAGCTTTAAAPLLRCEVTYAGAMQVVEVRMVTDPYTVAAVEVGGRFLFKPVMVGRAGRVDYIKLYAYLDTNPQPVPIQVTTYRPPFKTGAAPLDLTGEQHLYGGPVERELIYRCTLQGVVR